ncbi:alpha/beta hydrolase domain-containing protein [Sphingomonas sp. LT1P40]|uniref:alpha/beta hydrolase domain-containing protein n=1 Tax=Alteristakelama amylovorans TaxID=3096166 RepID=UPI002FC6711F
MIRSLFLAGSLLTLTAPACADTVRRAPAPTAQSQIWLDPGLPGTPEGDALAKAGYIREEWFQTGTANVYAYDAAGKVMVERADVPYTTRLIVIRPRDAKKFSGTVQLNPFHPVMGNSSWGTIAEYAMQNGDAFVGVMIGADDNTRRMPSGPVPMMATKVLSWFNPTRYALINWPADEDGIRWDVFADTARLIRSATGPLKGLKVTRTYAAGWSFTGSFLRTYINSGFHAKYRLPNGKPLIDGYLLGISSFSFRSGYVPLNSRTPMLANTDPRRTNVAIDAPVIELQSENEAITNRDPQTPDKDTTPGAHRLYEVPGLTHGSGRRRGTVSERQIATRLGQPQPARQDSCTFAQTDIDMAAFAQAAHANLNAWSRRNIAAPRAERLQHDGGKQRRDANGNTLGGIRPAQITVPLARYGAAPADAGCDTARPGVGSPSLPMRRVPLDAARLATLYPGGKAEYLVGFDAAIDKLVAERWLRAPDAAAQKSEARKYAEEAFK